MVLDPTAELILIVTDAQAYDAMVVQLHRIGYDNIIGYLYGGIAAWQEAGYPIDQLWQISPAKLNTKIGKKNTATSSMSEPTPNGQEDTFREPGISPAFIA